MFGAAKGEAMLKTKRQRRMGPSLRRRVRYRKWKSLAPFFEMGTDIEAFYAAQKEAARASREYVARRKQR